MKLSMTVPYGIMRKVHVSLFDLSNNMAAVPKIEHKSQTTVFRKYLEDHCFRQIMAYYGIAKVFNMMRATCVPIFVKICPLMFELLPLFDIFGYFMLFFQINLL